MRWLVICCFLAGAGAAAAAQPGDGNRLGYLDASDPFYVSRTFPRLATPQWVGEAGVEAVVILSIDDMRGHEKWETFLRPLIERLKRVDGRAPLSIMTCQIDPRHPHLQTWLAEGLSLETHTYDHPCPLLGKGDFAAAKATYDRAVDQMAAVPGSRGVAFRTPCCDSLNTPSPRFFAEIFNRTTPSGNFLEIDSSVFNIITADDPELPRELVLDAAGREIFRRYLPFESYVVTVEDYPYPYVIGRLCWELPCVVPSDWSAQHVQRPDNPRTVADWKRALDAAVAKQGVFTLVFHPHKWITAEQLIELVDHAVQEHGRKVKFLNFREAAERLNKHLLVGNPLRRADGGDNGVRLLDVDGDGSMDVVIGNAATRKTRLWNPGTVSWNETDFPIVLDDRAAFGVVHADGSPTVFRGGRAWHFDGRQWVEDPALVAGLPRFPENERVRLCDFDGDGTCELIAAGATGADLYRLDDQRAWRRLPFGLPPGTALFDSQGRDAGLRFVDLDEDGRLDVLSSNEAGYAACLFVSNETGWSRELVSGKPGDAKAIPMISRDGTNNGAWIHGRTLWVQNEHTDRLSDLVARQPLDALLSGELFPGSKSPAQALKLLRARPGFTVEQMAAEPLVVDPVSFAWGPDGKLWVVEMGDYPRGRDGQGKPGGRVRFLEDTDGDGRYDRSTLFLDELGFPNGVAPWRGGVIVSCAPDVIYAEDTDGDGRADQRQVLYAGFLTGNPQHRVNGFSWGMDGWLYGGHADAAGGKIRLTRQGGAVSANGRDFRIRPDEGLLDPQWGVSQYGRNRDDWGNWFGNENSNPMFHYVLADHYLRRNPLVPAAGGKLDVFEQPGAAEVFPRSRTIARYNDLYAANRFTSANSAIVYRDDLFGPAFEGSVFVSEPVHNLVHREVMRPEGVSFKSRRADDEQHREFLASSDNWFRPTTLATGPDGALWVADMYRQTIEHPQWIPQSVQDQIDLRAGDDRGRIYRVYPVGATPRKIPRLDRLSIPELAAALDSPSGWQRDMAQQVLVWRNDAAAAEPLRSIARDCPRPISRAQALWTMELLRAAAPADVARGLRDPHPGVRRHAAQIAEAHLAEAPELGEALLALADDADLQVRLQTAYSLGEWRDARAGAALGRLAVAHQDNPFLTAAALSSVNKDNLAGALAEVLEARPEPPPELLEQLVAMASALDDEPTLATALGKIGRAQDDGTYAAWQLTALAGLLDALARRGAGQETYDADRTLAAMFDFARGRMADDGAADDERMRAARLLGRSASDLAADVAALAALLTPQASGDVQTAAVEALARIDSAEVPPALVAGWRSHGPQLRSQVLDALLSRPQWSRALLGAVQQGAVSAADVDAARRQRLLRSDDQAIRDLAARLLAGSIETNRAQVVEQFQSALQKTGDASAGSAVFTKRCAVCHRLRGVGHEVGPNLASLTDYSPQALLVALLDPNRAVEARYLEFLALTSAGTSYTGMLASENGNSVTLLGQEGKQQTILRSDLEALTASGKSLMPEGLEKDLSETDLVNVIAHLRASGAPRKTFPANRPRLVTPTADGTLQLYPTNCEVYGSTVVLEPLYKNLGKWQSENDRALWNVELPRAGRFAVFVNYACLDQDAGNTWLLEAGERQLSGRVESTGSVDQYREVRAGEVELPSGPSQLVFRSSGPVRGRLLQLGGILLKPAK